MSRDAIEREKNIFLKKAKIQNENQKIAKKENAKGQEQSSLETFVTGKTDRRSKGAAIFSIHLEPAEKSGRPSYRNAGSCGTFDIPRHISPLKRPPSMKRLSPSLPDGPSFFFKKVRCGLNLEQR
jgi:hypothetical protein